MSLLLEKEEVRGALLYLTFVFVHLEREQVMRAVSDYSRFDLPQLLPASN